MAKMSVPSPHINIKMPAWLGMPGRSFHYQATKGSNSRLGAEYFKYPKEKWCCFPTKLSALHLRLMGSKRNKQIELQRSYEATSSARQGEGKWRPNSCSSGFWSLTDGLPLAEQYSHCCTVAAAGLVKLRLLGPVLPIISAEKGSQGEVGTRKCPSSVNLKQCKMEQRWR